MRIQPIKGDLLSVTTGLLVHGCNAQGVMGAGLALAVRTRYPAVYEDYTRYMRETHPSCRLGGVMFTQATPTLVVASGITQEWYGRQSSTQYTSYGALRQVFKKVNEYALAQPIHPTIAFGRIGAGLGNGQWDRIATIICECLDPRLELYLYTPIGYAA